MKGHIIIRSEFFREGDVYVGVCPDLNVSSFGETIEEAKQSLREALTAFFEECEAMGTLHDVLEEAGFIRQDMNWLPRQPIAIELFSVA